MQFHFLSGLPRSGTTLLASILRQNPAVHSTLLSPLGQVVIELHHALSANEAAIYISGEQRKAIISGVFENYYADIKADIVVDNNRRWCAKWPLLARVFPDARMVCCVRPLAWVADSVERLVRNHPLQLSAIYNFQPNTTVYGRMQILMNPDSGLIGYAYNALRDAFFGPHNDRILIVDYDQFTKDPAKVLQTITAFLSLPPFNYDFDHIQQLPGATEFDERLGTPGLHLLGGRVIHASRGTILPPDVFDSFAPPFWR